MKFLINTTEWLFRYNNYSFLHTVLFKGKVKLRGNLK